MAGAFKKYLTDLAFPFRVVTHYAGLYIEHYSEGNADLLRTHASLFNRTAGKAPALIKTEAKTTKVTVPYDPFALDNQWNEACFAAEQSALENGKKDAPIELWSPDDDGASSLSNPSNKHDTDDEGKEQPQKKARVSSPEPEPPIQFKSSPTKADLDKFFKK